MDALLWLALAALLAALLLAAPFVQRRFFPRKQEKGRALSCYSKKLLFTTRHMKGENET